LSASDCHHATVVLQRDANGIVSIAHWDPPDEPVLMTHEVFEGMLRELALHAEARRL
jgi:hypothetical protein